MRETGMTSYQSYQKKHYEENKEKMVEVNARKYKQKRKGESWQKCNGGMQLNQVTYDMRLLIKRQKKKFTKCLFYVFNIIWRSSPDDGYSIRYIKKKLSIFFTLYLIHSGQDGQHTRGMYMVGRSDKRYKTVMVPILAFCFERHISTFYMDWQNFSLAPLDGIKKTCKPHYNTASFNWMRLIAK